MFINHLAFTMNSSNNIIIQEHKLFVQQGIQFYFAKFEFIDHVCINEQDCQLLSP